MHLLTILLKFITYIQISIKYSPTHMFETGKIRISDNSRKVGWHCNNSDSFFFHSTSHMIFNLIKTVIDDYAKDGGPGAV